MLLDFTIENWKAFSRENSLNLVATRERQHGQTLAKIDGFRTLKTVPAAAVYGGNASGKTSLFEALAFLRNLVIAGPEIGAPLAIEPFRLNPDAVNATTLFDITFLTNGTVYRLEVSLSPRAIEQEVLSILRDNKQPAIVYERSRQNITVSPSYFESDDRMRFIADGTPQNRLFLTNAVMQNVGELLPIYTWFKDSLTMVGVPSRMESLGMFYTRKDFLPYVSERLRELDTGIEEVIGEPVDPNMVPVPPFALQQAQSAAAQSSGAAVAVTSEMPNDYSGEMYFITFDKGTVNAQRLRTRHKSSDGTLVTFPLQAESSGSRRLLSLMPMLFVLFGSDPTTEKVFIVDELDRSLHSMLTAKIIETFLATCDAKSRRQLLFTTHDLLLMDQALMRRDEMFITERSSTGESEIIRLTDYEGLRYDRDLLRSYLDGRFGGVPMLSETLGADR